VDWIHLAQDRYQWRALVSTVMNFLVPKKCSELLAEQLSTFQEGLCLLELVFICSFVLHLDGQQDASDWRPPAIKPEHSTNQTYGTSLLCAGFQYRLFVSGASRHQTARLNP
jgi:hypothetical protein